MTHRAVGPDPKGRWHVALNGLGVMDCPTETVACREAAKLDKGLPRAVQRLAHFEMYEDDIEILRELDDNYGMRPGSPLADGSTPF